MWHDREQKVALMQFASLFMPAALLSDCSFHNAGIRNHMRRSPLCHCFLPAERAAMPKPLAFRYPPPLHDIQQAPRNSSLEPPSTRPPSTCGALAASWAS